MFTPIKTEIQKASKLLDTTEILEYCPVYVFKENAEISTETCVFYGESLLRELEQSELFSELNDAFVALTVIKMSKTSEKSRFGISITDAYGNIRYTLSDWMEGLAVEQHITKGIIWLRIDQYTDLIDNRFWYNGLIKTIAGYKEDFIFILSCKDKTEQLISDIRKYCLCKETLLGKIDNMSFSLILLKLLREQGFRLNEEARAAVTKFINDNASNIDITAIENMARSIIWNYLIAQNSINSKKRSFTVTANFIDADFFNVKIPEDRQAKHIGFRGDVK